VRIAYVITRADAVGGASIHVRDMARFMREHGHEVMVLVGGVGPVTAQLAAAAVPFLSLRYLLRSVHPFRDLRAVGELQSALRSFRPDLLSLHTAKAGYIGRIAAGGLGIPALYTPHGWPFGERFGPLSRLGFGLLEKAISRHAAAIVCVCRYEKDLALRQGIADGGRLRVIHNGVHDVAPELLARPDAAPARIVSVARLESPKDHRTLLRALALLKSMDWTLDLVGDGPLEEDLTLFARELDLGDRVHFAGYQSDPAKALSRAQVFALATRSEAFPRGILEAMRAGLPVVASQVGGIPEAVSESTGGLLVSPGKPDKLASALGRLLTDAGLRRELGARARRTYESRFRFERMAAETLEVYRQFT
jgi:glycosyltransferase involved in cell wall biosynthesis